MTVQSHLDKLATLSIVKDAEREKIQKSLNSIATRLKLHFGSEISKVVVFGSYKRNTILPRFMDDGSDIDLMVIFVGSYAPQTYLRKLRGFVEKYYTSSEIKQSNPTIVLNLSHIKFELAPAIDHFMWGLQIPAKASDYQNWINTNPNDFNADLSRVNQAHSNRVIPTIRLIKYWNAVNSKPFDSYLLEKGIVEQSDFIVSFWNEQQTLPQYLLNTFLSLELNWGAPTWKRDRVDRAHTLASDIQSKLRQGREIEAERLLLKLLPDTGETVLTRALRSQRT